MEVEQGGRGGCLDISISGSIQCPLQPVPEHLPRHRRYGEPRYMDSLIWCSQLRKEETAGMAPFYRRGSS